MPARPPYLRMSAGRIGVVYYSFYLNVYVYLVSLEPQMFGFPLDSCRDALPVSHGDLDASFSIF